MKLDSRDRRFVSLARTISHDGSYAVLDAIDNEGNAWWLVIGDEKAPDDWTQLQPLPQS